MFALLAKAFASLVRNEHVPLRDLDFLVGCGLIDSDSFLVDDAALTADHEVH